MQIPPDLARCSVRFSTGRMTTKEEMLKASETIADAVMQTHNAPSAGRL
jgi:cysteine sulfinate desulfinase/cysteine desulfurase-like protein